MATYSLGERAASLAAQAEALAQEADNLARETAHAVAGASSIGADPLVTALTVFALAVIIGYYVVWGVTPALHSPLMAVTNAISSVIIVGALLAAGPASFDAFDGMTASADGHHIAPLLGFGAIILASINIFGGFIVSHRMLAMFKKKPRREKDS